MRVSADAFVHLVSEATVDLSSGLLCVGCVCGASALHGESVENLTEEVVTCLGCIASAGP